MRRRIRICLACLLIACCVAAVASAEGIQPTSVINGAHQNMLASTITYKYTQINSGRDWSSYIAAAVSNWNNASLSGTDYPSAVKPRIVRTTGTPQVDIQSFTDSKQDVAGRFYDDLPDTSMIRHYRNSYMDLNDAFWESSANYKTSCVAHEFGHRFGLGDNRASSGVLMYYLNYAVTTPQWDDRNGVARLWNSRCRNGS